MQRFVKPQKEEDEIHSKRNVLWGCPFKEDKLWLYNFNGIQFFPIQLAEDISYRRLQNVQSFQTPYAKQRI
jgi:hypothetical protein